MDPAIREQLLAAESRRDAQALKNAYELIKAASQGKSALHSSDHFSTDLYVLCAEQAFQLGYLEMSSDCLQMYFKGKFPVNQFLGRAYLCQGQLHTPLSTDNLEEFEWFVLFFMKAIEFATHDQRYYFLIYNASVLYCQLVRPFLQPGFRYCLIPSLAQIVKALNQAEEPDREWRAELMVNLLECFIDASKLEEAKEFSSTAAIFIKEHVPDKYSQIFSLMVYHKLLDISQVEKEIQNSIHLAVIYKMQMLKFTKTHCRDPCLKENATGSLGRGCAVCPENSLSWEVSWLWGAWGRGAIQIHVGEGVAETGDTVVSKRLWFSTQVVYNSVQMRQWDTDEFPSDAAAHLNSVYVLLRQCDGPPALLPGVKIPLILELARFSMKVNCVELARACILDLKRAGLTEQGKLIEIGCLEREYEVKKVGANVTYTKGVAEAQLELITSLEVTLKHAVQLGDPGVIQVVCTTLWNVCFPLLQHSLHQRVRKPLAAVADALEEIDSVLVLLRCQVHTELARIEEDEDRMEAAMEHVQKAVCLARSGQCREHLRLTLNRLRAVLYPSPERLEDRAAVLMEQAKRREQKDDMRKKRALLVNAGHALAPDSFQTVLDSENEAKVAAGKSRSEISCLCARAQHHIKSVERVDEHLKLLQNENSRERIILWADLAKVARAQEVWDVCRAACRFCLCYDDALFRRVTKPRQAQKRKGSRAVLDADRGDSLPGQSSLPAKSSSAERHLLRTLAEIRLLSAEATVHLLRLQGIELNDHAVPPEETSHSHPGYVSHLHESDPEWKTYSLWIDCLSQYAMDNFHRAAEIGKELNEAWIVHNAVVHVLNYNRHLISSGRQREIIECLQTLLGAIRTVGYNGSTAVLLMLCNALARGLILCWIPKPRLAAKDDTDAATDRSRKAAAKRHKKANIIQSSSVDPRGLPDVRAALEICEFALTVPTEAPPGEAVPVAAQQQIIATWVKAKQLNRQQIEHNLGAEEENNDEAQNPLARILVGLEMYSCNGLGLLDFAVPSLSQLVKLAVECSWSDSLVELQTLTRLMYFAYVSRDHEMVMACSKKILQSDENFCHTGDIKECDTPVNRARREMVSTAACIQGRSMMENSPGGKHVCVAASKAFVQSARNAGEAGNYSLAMSAARHFWNACLPLLGSPHDRKQFKEPTEVILQNIIKAESKNKQEKKDMLPLHQWITKDFQSIGSSGGSFLPGAEEDLALRTSLYGLLFHIYADKADWDTALQVLDEAITVLPQTRHMLYSLIFKHMATAKAALGCDFMMDVQKLRDEGEDYLSRVWRRLGAVSRSTAGQLSCFQNAVVALQKQENDWQKVNYLMEFAEWLYCNQFPISDVTKALDWVVDLLLHMEFSMRSSQEEGKTTIPKFSPTEYLRMDIGASDTTPQINLEDLRNIKHLEALFRAQTLMALVSGQGSPVHQQHCLLACACVVRIWQVALAASGPLTKVLSKPSQLAAPQKSVITPKPEKDRKKEKQVDLGAVREKLKERGSAATLPANVEEWAEYDCPREIRDTFKHETNSHGINRDNFPKPTCTLYFMELLSKELQKIFCPHLVLPIFQLAEVLAGEVVECRSLSDLYHLRFVSFIHFGDREPERSGPTVNASLDVNKALCDFVRTRLVDTHIEEFLPALTSGDVIENVECALFVQNVFMESHYERVFLKHFLVLLLELPWCWQEIALRKANQVRATAEEGELFFENARLKVVGDENCLTSQEKVLISTPVSLINYSSHFIFIHLLVGFWKRADLKSFICSGIGFSRTDRLTDCAGEVGLTLNLAFLRYDFFELNAGTGTGLSALSFPYLWMEKAEVLLRLGACQPAGVLLSEAHAAAQELGALCDVSRCLYLLAVLAKLEGSHGQARALLEKAQLLGGSEQFWYSSTLVLVGAILEEEEEGKQSMACETLERTVNVLRAAFLQRPNRQAELGFMITSLEARKTLIQIHLVPDCATVNAEPCQLPHGLQESYSKLVQLEKDFSHYGHKTCSAEMLLERANIHRMIAKQERRKAAKHSHYLDASNLAQRAVSTTEEVFHGVCSLCAVNETTNISIPLMRQLANRKINFVEILLDIFHLVITEKKLEVGEASWHTFVEAFTREASEDDAAEQGWKRMECAVAHIILAQLANVQELSTGCAAIRSKCLYLAGKTLRLLAMNRDPVQPKAYWKLNVTAEAKSDRERTCLRLAEGSAQGVTDSRAPASTRQREACGRKRREFKKDHKLSQNYLSQSSEALLQGLGVAFRHGVTDVLAPAGLEMVECFQQFDPVSTSQFLAVHQSCSASVMMKSILLTAASHSSSSLLAALLHLQNHLSQNRNARDRLKNVEQQLAATSAAWRNLCVPVEHFSIMEELPLNFCVIILQHSEDRSDLYGSVVWKPKASAQQKGKPAWPTVHAGVCRHPVDPDTFGVLLDKVRLYKQQQMQRRLQQPVTQNSQGGAPQTDVCRSSSFDMFGSLSQRKTAAIEINLLEGVLYPEDLPLQAVWLWTLLNSRWCKLSAGAGAQPDFSNYAGNSTGPHQQLWMSSPFTNTNACRHLVELIFQLTPPEKTDADGHDGTSDFSEILEIMEDYLKPVLTQLDFSDIREQSTAVLAAESRKIQVKDKDTRHTRMQGTSVGSGLCVVLLADTLFMELPLEALSIFGEEGISSVSRDFSLQFLYNRVHVAEAESGVNTAVQRSKGTKPKSKPHQKKNVRMAPVSRDLPSDCLPVDARRFKYLVDPYNEGIEAGAVSPSQKVKEILEKHHGLFPLQWQGVTGNSCVPGQAGWEQLLSDCSAFLFYGMERFLSHVSPARLVAMNIPECRLVMLLDLVRSEKSYRRIRNSDTHKSCLPTAVEGPTEAAALLSLAGARSIIANQWYTTLQENAERLEILSENLLSVGRTTGQTVRILQKGKVHRDGDPTEAEAESHSSPGGKAEERRSHPSSHLPATHPSFFNCVLYGLPTAIMMRLGQCFLSLMQEWNWNVVVLVLHLEKLFRDVFCVYVEDIAGAQTYKRCFYGLCLGIWSHQAPFHCVTIARLLFNPPHHGIWEARGFLSWQKQFLLNEANVDTCSMLVVEQTPELSSCWLWVFVGSWYHVPKQQSRKSSLRYKKRENNCNTLTLGGVLMSLSAEVLSILGVASTDCLSADVTEFICTCSSQSSFRNIRETSLKCSCGRSDSVSVMLA
ncbi:cilia- and flagella-associated protein 46 [Rhynochetos jubatus]